MLNIYILGDNVMLSRSALGMALLAISSCVFDSSQIIAADPINVLFLGDQGHHRPSERFRQLQPILRERGILLTYTENVDDLSPKRLQEFAGLIVYANIDNIDAAQEKALLDFVAGGKGFIPIHCASFCFRNSDAYVKLVGAQFQRHETGVFRTTISDSDHPILKGYQGFESWDETYVHTKHNEQDRVVLEYRIENGSREPWSWVRTHGKGRVFYTAWGHDERTFGHPGFHNLIERGIRWTVGGDATSVASFLDRPKITQLRQDLKPFQYVDADVPFYPPGKQWGTTERGQRPMQLPVSPEESIQHMVTPMGFEVRLFASEKDLQGKPLAMNWDERGRLWICETSDYPNDLQPRGQGRDRIRICEDTDGDAVADKFTVFAEQLSIPSAITFYRDGAIVQDGPQTMYLKDLDGDDQADLRLPLITGWALGDTHGGVSNFQYGLDNWYYAMQGYNNSEPVLTNGRSVTPFRMGFFRFKVEGQDDKTAVTEIEFLRSTNNNTWGIGLSEEGLIFGSTANGNPSEFLSIPNRYYESVRGWSSTVLTGIADSNQFEPATEKVRQVDHHGGFTAAAGHALYTARNYPPEYWNRAAFVTEPTGHLCATFIIRPDGAGFRSKNSWNLLAGNDEWMAPIMAEVGPDGNVWVIDWYNYIVQHNPTPAGYKTGKGNAYESELRDKKRGRIYRLVYRGEKRATSPKQTGDAAQQARNDLQIRNSSKDAKPTRRQNFLIAMMRAGLNSDNFLSRRHTQQWIVEHGGKDLVPELLNLLTDTSVDSIGLNTAAIHALWTLHGLGALTATEDNRGNVKRVAESLRHPSAGVRRNAVFVLPRDDGTLKAILESQTHKDPDPQVRLAALLTLSELPPALEGGRISLAALDDNVVAADRWLLDAATSAAARHDIYFLKELLARAKVSNAQRSKDSHPVALNSKVQERVAIVAEHYARSAPTETVVQLLDLLATAAAPDAESVVNGLAKGWPKDRPLSLSADDERALVRLVNVLPAASRGSLVNLASRWQSPALEAHVAEIAKSYLAIATDDKRSDADRFTAARQLVEFRRNDVETIHSLVKLITPRASNELAKRLVEAIGLSEASQAADTLIAQMPSFTPSVRADAMRILSSRKDWTQAMLEGLESGKLMINELSLDQKQALAGHPDKQIAKQMQSLLAKGGSLPNPDRQKVIDELSPFVLNVGDPAAGKEVFKKTCAKCHVHGGEGTKIGPDLTGMAVHPKRELIVQILDPSRSVEGNFRIYTVVTDEGKVLNGLLASETKSAIEIVDSEAKRQLILRENIDELIVSQKSLMPEGFEKQHSPQELRDLLEFLTLRGKYLPIPFEKAATAISTKGLFHSESATVERLVFSDWSPKTFDGVPFHLVDPQGDRVANIILLHGPQGYLPPQMPNNVVLPCNSPAKAVHLLSGVSGWGFPATSQKTTSLVVRLLYADGQTEDHELKNGEHFADYIRRVDVPGSKFAFDLHGQQIRYLAIVPQRSETIAQIELIKGKDRTAPIVMAVTVETR